MSCGDAPATHPAVFSPPPLPLCPPSPYHSRVKRKKAPLEDQVHLWALDRPLLKDGDARQATERFLLSPSSANSQRTYFQVLKRFYAWAEKNEVASLAAVDGPMLRRHVEGILPATEKTRATRNGKTQRLAYTVLVTYFDALVFAKVLESTTVRSYKPRGLATQTTATPALTPAELARLLKAIPADTPLGRRNRALVIFLVGTACRIGAALKLTHRSLYDLDGMPHATLHEKGNTTRQIPLARSVTAALDAHLPSAGNPDHPVFQAWDQRRKCLTDRPMPYIEAYTVIRKAASVAGITKAITPHSLRATAITALRANGHDIETAQRIAGHAHPDTTRLYDRRTHAVRPRDMDTLAEALDLNNPGAA